MSAIKLNGSARRVAEDIIKRGNDVEIRRKGDGYVVIEVKKEIKYSSPH